MHGYFKSRDLGKCILSTVTAGCVYDSYDRFV